MTPRDGMCLPLRNVWDPTGTHQILSTQSRPRPVSVSQEGFGRKRVNLGWDGGEGCCLEDLGRVITREWKPAHTPPLWEAKRGTGCTWG